MCRPSITSFSPLRVCVGVDSVDIDRDLPTGALMPTLPDCKSLPDSVRALIIQCWRVNPHERPTAQQTHQQCEAELAALAPAAPLVPAPALPPAIELVIPAPAAEPAADEAPVESKDVELERLIPSDARASS